MIVFAVHERTDWINSVLNQLKQFNEKDVLLVDTNSKTNDVKQYFLNLNLEQFRFKIFYERLDYDCYDTGAYIHAFKNYDYDTFYFFQDSIEFINPKIFETIDVLLHTYEVVAISSFPLIFDNQEQINWIMSNISQSEIAKISGRKMFGIFGPMFSIKKESMNLIPKEWLIHPTIKNEAMAMERKWSIIFNIMNFKTTYLESDHMDFLSTEISNNFINKTRLVRQ